MSLRLRDLPAGNQSPATLFAALVLVALVPAVGVLWFMTVAMRNERLAVQERLTAVYANHLASSQQRATAFVRERQAALAAQADGTPAETFAAIVRAEVADAVIVTDAAGKALYPSAAAGTDVKADARVEENGEWAHARESEFQKNDFAGAAEIYGRIADASREANPRAQAMLLQAACWLRAGEKERALGRLAQLTADASLRNARSAQGMLIGPNAQLLVLKTLGPPRPAAEDVKLSPDSRNAHAFRHAQTLSDLVTRLNDYTETNLPANQRRFLMSELQILAPTPNLFPTLAAENLAAEYLDLDLAPPADAKLQRTPLAQVWRLASNDRTVIALWRQDRLRAELAQYLDALALPDVRVSVLAPDDAVTTRKMPVPPHEAGELLPGWRLALSFRDGDPLAEASARQAQFYLWVGVGLVAIIGLLSWLVARTVAAQMRLARMKDELVSTVSHELKTPVASMRILLDTLAAGRCRDEAHQQRYLQLATKENRRLSQLIGNFLVFSRLERGRPTFRFAAVSPQEVVRTAVDALDEKLAAPSCRLTTQFDPGLPLIRGDAAALSTVLVNLLDNAHKYTNAEKHIDLRAYTEGEHVVIAVSDNGIGIAVEERERIFDRFYQIDQSLTRERGGCGLGLSIVQSIVRAHGGAVEVTSAPGQGSTFRIKLPLAGPDDVLAEPTAAAHQLETPE